MAEHTTTPWICDSEGILPISRDGVSIVARIPNHPENKKNWDADAAFIVKAVNNHEALVKIAEAARDYLSAEEGFRPADRLRDEINGVLAAIGVGQAGGKP